MPKICQIGCSNSLESAPCCVVSALNFDRKLVKSMLIVASEYTGSDPTQMIIKRFIALDTSITALLYGDSICHLQLHMSIAIQSTVHARLRVSGTDTCQGA